MARSVATRILQDHLVEGELVPGSDIAIRIDQTLTQDATGTLVMLELEAMGLDRIKTEVSTQYVDHNLIQEDHKNPDDHRFLQSAAARFGLHYSRPGNGVSHPVHQQRFGRPGATLAGSDSHSPAAGAIGMVAIGSGGLDVALAMAGEPLRIKAPEIWGIELTGELPDWVSAKDVILEMLRRHGVDGGVGRIIEYHGAGLSGLSAMDRHVIANMGAELGATTTVFPADDVVRAYLASYGREDDFTELVEPDPVFDVEDSIELSELVPLVAEPTSPGNVVTVESIAGKPISQAYIGSSANPGYRDIAIVAQVLKAADAKAHPDVSLDVNPSSRSILADLTRDGHLFELVSRGARIHQAGCNGCIGMGQAPATDTISLRTTPRNFPNRSGTKEDKVHLVSPETAVASAITGVITDPRTLGQSHGITFPRVTEPTDPTIDEDLIQAPPSPEVSRATEIVKGPNIDNLPELESLPDGLSIPILLKVGDDVSTDEILRAGTEVLPYRSNIPRIAQFTFDVVDETYPSRAEAQRDNPVEDTDGGHAIVGGSNYGQGSSREHAAIAPRYLGLRVVVVEDYARIHWQNLANFGVLALQFDDPADLQGLEQGDVLHLSGLHDLVATGNKATITVTDAAGADKGTIAAHHTLSERQRGYLGSGGITNWMRDRLE